MLRFLDIAPVPAQQPAVNNTTVLILSITAGVVIFAAIGCAILLKNKKSK